MQGLCSIVSSNIVLKYCKYCCFARGLSFKKLQYCRMWLPILLCPDLQTRDSSREKAGRRHSAVGCSRPWRLDSGLVRAGAGAAAAAVLVAATRDGAVWRRRAAFTVTVTASAGSFQYRVQKCQYVQELERLTDMCN